MFQLYISGTAERKIEPHEITTRLLAEIEEANALLTANSPSLALTPMEERYLRYAVASIHLDMSARTGVPRALLDEQKKRKRRMRSDPERDVWLTREIRQRSALVEDAHFFNMHSSVLVIQLIHNGIRLRAGLPVNDGQSEEANSEAPEEEETATNAS